MSDIINEARGYEGTRGNATTDSARGDHWKDADEARARANDLLAQAQEAVAEADAAERRAISADEGVDHEKVDPLEGTWEGRVTGSEVVADEEAAPEEAAPEE